MRTTDPKPIIVAPATPPARVSSRPKDKPTPRAKDKTDKPPKRTRTHETETDPEARLLKLLQVSSLTEAVKQIVSMHARIAFLSDCNASREKDVATLRADLERTRLDAARDVLEQLEREGLVVEDRDRTLRLAAVNPDGFRTLMRDKLEAQRHNAPKRKLLH